MSIKFEIQFSIYIYSISNIENTFIEERLSKSIFETLTETITLRSALKLFFHSTSIPHQFKINQSTSIYVLCVRPNANTLSNRHWHIRIGVSLPLNFATHREVINNPRSRRCPQNFSRFTDHISSLYIDKCTRGWGVNCQRAQRANLRNDRLSTGCTALRATRQEFQLSVSFRATATMPIVVVLTRGPVVTRSIAFKAIAAAGLTTACAACLQVWHDNTKVGFMGF